VKVGQYSVSVHDLIHKPGAMRKVELNIVTEDAMANYAIGVAAGSKLEIDLKLESVHEGIYVSGEVFGEAQGECGRCLDPINGELEVDFQELFAYSGTSEDDFTVEAEQIDLEQVIRDAVVLSLPFQPVCNEDCLGLCATCGEKILNQAQHVHEAPIDPRWNALQKLKED
jgi:uncharacterized protein